VISVGGECNAYVVGSASTSKRAILINTDIFGIGGRLPAIADQLAKECDCLAIVVDFFAPGEACSPDILAAGMEALEKWVRNRPWEGLRDKYLVHATAFAKSKGAEKLGLIGFCYGSWVSFRVGADPLLRESFCCAVDCHPSVNLEDWLFGGTSVGLAEKSAFPHLMLSAENEKDFLKEGGAVIQALEKLPCGKYSKVKDFPEMKHGWVNRGDLSDPTVARDIKLALQMAQDYFNQRLE